MLYKIIAVLSLFGSMDEKGWVSVEKPQKAETHQIIDESDHTWPAFIRQFGADKVVIRFPEEPRYSYPRLAWEGSKVMQIEGSKEGVLHRLLVQPAPESFDAFIEQKKLSLSSQEDSLLVSSDSIDHRTVDLLYRSEKKWVRERIFVSKDHIYLMQTISESLDGAPYLQFVGSFDLEIRDGNKVFHREIQS